MKHITYGGRSLLMSDASAHALIDYAAALGAESGADTVTLAAIGMEGNEVEVTFLLNSASVLIVESASGRATPPANEEAVAQIRERTQWLRQPPPTQPQFFDDEVPDSLRGMD